LNNFPKEYLIALDASVKASNTLMQFYSEDFITEIKKDGSPVTEADLASSKVIIESLTPTEIPILGEESFKEEYSKRKNWNLNWCVDPLDGT